MNGGYVKVNKPGQRVLIHRIDVRQVGDGEEQDRRMLGDRTIALARFIDLLLGLFGNLKQADNMNNKIYLNAHAYARSDEDFQEQ